jgi:RNA polymerase sigma-70 factor (ECF subfamily)
LQEALLKAYCNLQQFRENSQFYTWLVRITVNEALMNLRKRRHTQVPLEAVVETERGAVQREFGDRSKDPERYYAEQELRETLAQALKGLSPRLCAAFVLRNVEEMSMRETAAVLGLSASAVKSRVVRARARLRKRLQKMFLARAVSRPESQEHAGRATVERLAATPEEPPSFADAAA